MSKELTDAFLDYAHRTEVFLSDQIPDLFSQVFALGLYLNVLSILISVPVVFFCLMGVFKINKNYSEAIEKRRSPLQFIDFPDISYFLLWSGVVIFSFCIVLSIYDLVFLWVAPKLYLIKYFK